MLAAIRFRGLPLELWFTLPVVVLSLYVLFRWQKFGEDAFAWNHDYFQLACGIGGAVWIASFFAGMFPEFWQIALFWIVGLLIAIPAFCYWSSLELGNAAILSLLIAVVGIAAMPIPRIIREFMFGKPQLSAASEAAKLSRRNLLDGIPMRSFAFHLPAGWHETTEDGGTRTYTRRKDGSGFLHVSFQPPLENDAKAGAGAERELARLLDALGQEMGIGRRLALAHEEGSAGIMAFADYWSDAHGHMRFWLLPSEVTVFASYTDGRSAVSEREIAEAHETLKAGKFE